MRLAVCCRVLASLGSFSPDAIRRAGAQADNRSSFRPCVYKNINRALRGLSHPRRPGSRPITGPPLPQHLTRTRAMGQALKGVGHLTSRSSGQVQRCGHPCGRCRPYPSQTTHKRSTNVRPRSIAVPRPFGQFQIRRAGGLGLRGRRARDSRALWGVLGLMKRRQAGVCGSMPSFKGG